MHPKIYMLVKAGIKEKLTPHWAAVMLYNKVIGDQSAANFTLIEVEQIPEGTY